MPIHAHTHTHTHTRKQIKGGNYDIIVSYYWMFAIKNKPEISVTCNKKKES